MEIMDFIDLNQYVKPELLMLIPFLNIIGKLIKSSVIADRHIPLILLAIGIVLSCAWLFVMEGEVFSRSLVTGIVQGGIVSGFAVLGHQVVKQYSKKE